MNQTRGGDTTESGRRTAERPAGRSTRSRPSRLVWAIALIGAVAVAGVVWAFLALGDTSDGDDANVASDGAAVANDEASSGDETPEVIVIDEAEVDVVQNPSLNAITTDDGVRVQNDGNVTMRDVVVTVGADEICALGTLAPGDAADCQGATSGAVVTGSGPQGQPVEVTVG